MKGAYLFGGFLDWVLEEPLQCWSRKWSCQGISHKSSVSYIETATRRSLKGSSGVSGDVTLSRGTSSSGDSGSISMSSGAATSGKGGDIDMIRCK